MYVGVVADGMKIRDKGVFCARLLLRGGGSWWWVGVSCMYVLGGHCLGGGIKVLKISFRVRMPHPYGISMLTDKVVIIILIVCFRYFARVRAGLFGVTGCARVRVKGTVLAVSVRRTVPLQRRSN